MENEEELSVKVPGGMGFAFRGHQLFPTILVLLLSAVFTYLFFQSDAKAEKRATETVKAVQAMTQASEAQEATQRVMIYVLSLTQEERVRLNLMKPKELANMQR